MKLFNILLLLGLFSSVSLSANLPNFPFVVSAGHAEQKVKPNEAVIRIRLVAFERESKNALEKVTKASNEVTNVLKKYSIDLNQLEASNLEKSTTRERGKNYKDLEVLGYEVARSLTLKISKLDRYSGLMNDVVAIDNI